MFLRQGKVQAQRQTRKSHGLGVRLPSGPSLWKLALASRQMPAVTQDAGAHLKPLTRGPRRKQPDAHRTVTLENCISPESDSSASFSDWRLCFQVKQRQKEKLQKLELKGFSAVLSQIMSRSVLLTSSAHILLHPPTPRLKFNRARHVSMKHKQGRVLLAKLWDCVHGQLTRRRRLSTGFET